MGSLKRVLCKLSLISNIVAAGYVMTKRLILFLSPLGSEKVCFNVVVFCFFFVFATLFVLYCISL